MPAQEEIDRLSQDEEIFDLESLITDGESAKIPITILFPKQDGSGNVKATAMIKPLLNTEVNNAARLGFSKTINTTYELEIVRAGLYTKTGEKFPDKLIHALPSGVVTELSKEILRVSGVSSNNKENLELAKELMGFSI